MTRFQASSTDALVPLSFAPDHLVLVVDDLAKAARELFDETGLQAIDGGNHRGIGTANYIVPLGPDYLELLAVVDEALARKNPWGQWTLACATHDEKHGFRGRRRLHALALRTSDIHSTAKRLGEEVGNIARTTPTGLELSAQLTGLQGALGSSALPFFIQWNGPAANQPGRQPAAHQISPLGIRKIEMADSGSVLTEIAAATPALRLVPQSASAGVLRCTIATTEGDIVISNHLA